MAIAQLLCFLRVVSGQAVHAGNEPRGCVRAGRALCAQAEAAEAFAWTCRSATPFCCLLSASFTNCMLRVEGRRFVLLAGTP